MKTIIIFFVVIILFEKVEAQECGYQLMEKDTVPDIPESEGYSGGNTAYINYIKSNIIVPKKVFTQNLDGDILICITVDTLGKRIKERIIRPIENCQECVSEAIRLLKNIKKFTPPIKGLYEGNYAFYSGNYWYYVGFHKNGSVRIAGK